MAWDVIETPWGETSPEISPDLAGSGGYLATRPLTVPTGAGRSETSLFLDFERDKVPAYLRVVMFGGYAGMGAARAHRRGESTVTLGGMGIGWRAQVHLDLSTSLPVADKVELLLVDGDGRILNAPGPHDEVRAAVSDALVAARDSDRGYAARAYVTMMNHVLPDMDEEVGHAEKEVERVRAVRDRARELVVSAEETSRSLSAAPAP